MREIVSAPSDEVNGLLGLPSGDPSGLSRARTSSRPPVHWLSGIP